jgi:AP-1 complex subunit beta-1
LTAVVKLFLKTAQSPTKRDESTKLLQTVLKEATSECDNPDIRDRAYIYWRLLSVSQDHSVAKEVILAEKPRITSTIPNLPQGLLEQLLTELSTLASVYHKPPATFMEVRRGKGLGGLMKLAIKEQRENAAENPIQVNTSMKQSNIENLLDIDFDGGAPASMQAQSGGLADLMSGGESGVQSPVGGGSNLDDLLSLGMGGGMAVQQGNGLSAGLGDLDISGTSTSPQPGGASKKTNQDILGLF